MSPRNIPAGNGRPDYKAENLIAVSKSHPQPITAIALLFNLFTLKARTEATGEFTDKETNSVALSPRANYTD
jgi:hypothetical protein